MDFSLRTVALTGIYLIWFGSGVAAYQIYPSEFAYLYLGFAILLTMVIIVFIYYVLQQRKEIEDDPETKRKFDEIVNNVHFPCGDPRTCERCSGFYWGFAIAATVAGTLLSGLIFQPEISASLSWWLIGLGGLGFVFSVTIHGLLNALIKLKYIDRFTFLVTGRTKIVAGIISGVSLVSVGIGVTTLVL